MFLFRRLMILAFFPLLIASAYPQTTAPDAANDRTTFRSNVRVVLLDVVVTDNKDEPVTGLPKNDFEVLEDGKPQTMASFDEHAGVPDIPASSSRGEVAPECLLQPASHESG